MPGYKTHLSFGFLVFSSLTYFLITRTIFVLPFSTILLGALICLLGSIFPDIDTTSKMQRIFYIFSAFFILFSLFTGNIILFLSFSLISVLLLILKHRTITHNFFFLLGISLIFPLFAYILHKNAVYTQNTVIIAISFGIGAFSHIFLDFFVSKILKK